MASAESILSGLDPEQRQVAEALGGPVVVLAGAGTGKTRAITHRIAYGVATGRQNPARSLAVTFTTRASGEMTRRLAALGVEGVRVRTFHSAALRQLRWAWPDAIGGDMHEVIASKAPLVASAAASNHLPNDRALIRDLSTEIEWAKAVECAPTNYQATAFAAKRLPPGGLGFDQVAAVYTDYERAKRTAGRMDFEDVLLLTVGVLQDRDDLRRQVQESFAHITVDEFQDVSGIQQRLLDIWLGDRDDVCVVGDYSQTIYSFTGANPQYLRGFAAKHKNAKTIHLTRCYRCTPEVVAMAEKIIAARPQVDLRSGGKPESSRLPLRSQRESGAEVKVVTHQDELSEATATVTQIKKLMQQGVPAGEIAILVRINALSAPFETALADAGVPYSVRGGRRFFERPEVRKGVALLRGAAKAASPDLPDPGDISSVARAVLQSAGWISRPPTEVGAVRETWESLAALVAVVDEVCLRKPGASLRDIVDELDRREETQDPPGFDGVTIASIHAAKGLEWDAVFVAGLVDGVIPMSFATTEENIAEERRLLYVAVTRARSYLFMSWSKSRLPGGKPRTPSRFLDGIEGVPASVQREQPRVKRARREPAKCRTCGKALVTAPERSIGRCRVCPSTANEELLEQLRSWRSAQIDRLSADRGKRLPPYIVATDATLEALAELNPSSLDELARIPGLGPHKLDLYGQDLLALMLTHG